MCRLVMCNDAGLTAVNLAAETVSDDGVRALAEALKTNSTVTALNLLTRCARSSNRTITALFLGANSVGAAGAQTILPAVRSNFVVTTLDLSSNSIGDTQLAAEALKCPALTQLDLHHNNIGDVGAKYIAEALKVNRVLTTLYLHNNVVGDGGARSIAQALKANYALSALFLAGNKISEEGSECIASAVESSNFTLCALYGVGCVDGVLERNKRILCKRRDERTLRVSDCSWLRWRAERVCYSVSRLQFC